MSRSKIQALDGKEILVAETPCPMCGEVELEKPREAQTITSGDVGEIDAEFFAPLEAFDIGSVVVNEQGGQNHAD